MMPMWIKEVQAIGQAFGTPLVALAASCIAYQQYRVAQQKLKSDLYPRRFAVYKTVISTVVNVLNSKTSDGEGKSFNENMIEARFLFDRLTFDYLSAIETRIFTLQYVRNINGNASEKARLINSDEKWLLEQLKIIPEKMHPFLNVDDKLTFSITNNVNMERIAKEIINNAIKIVS